MNCMNVKEQYDNNMEHKTHAALTALHAIVDQASISQCT